MKSSSAFYRVSPSAGDDSPSPRVSWPEPKAAKRNLDDNNRSPTSTLSSGQAPPSLWARNSLRWSLVRKNSSDRLISEALASDVGEGGGNVTPLSAISTSSVMSVMGISGNHHSQHNEHAGPAPGDKENKSGSSGSQSLPVTTSSSSLATSSPTATATATTTNSSPAAEAASPSASSGQPEQHGNRLSRLFSLRRSFGPGSFETPSKTSMPRLAEEEEQMLCGNVATPTTGRARGQAPPTLPAPPKNMTPEQQKRRHIISSLVHSENNYVATLQRLVNDYKRPLEDSSPPILSANKVSTLFYKVPDILRCHLEFRIALSEAIKNWDKEEKIGDVFVASFSKAMVLEIYSDFINNFSIAMDCAKQESKRKSALADFLKVKQITAHDRVSFFGLMVKPVQRFPQFILLLQDLLKETPPGHADRMALQLALTTLESLAEMLNERKREAEQFAAFRDKIRSVSGKFTTPRSTLEADGSFPRFLLKEDDMTQLEFSSSGLITRMKQRRLLLLNDLLLCVTVAGRTSEVDFQASLASSSASGQSSSGERLSLKWAVQVQDVEVVDGTAGGTLARLLAPHPSTSAASAASTLVSGKRASLSRMVTGNSNSSLLGGGDHGSSNSAQAHACSLQGQAESLAKDMADLMHDFDVVSRIAGLIGTMKTNYDGLSTDLTSPILSEIQRSIRQKDEEMAFMDASCLQIAVKSGEKETTYTFQTRDPNVKREWVVELRLARLALDRDNSPGWDVLEQERSISTKMPLYVKAFLVYSAPPPPQQQQQQQQKHHHHHHQHELKHGSTLSLNNGPVLKPGHSETNCGCSYSLMVQTPTRSMRKHTYVWSNVSDGPSSHLRIFLAQTGNTNLKELGTVSLNNLKVCTIQFVPGLTEGIAQSAPLLVAGHRSAEAQIEALRQDMVWVGTESQKIILYCASDPERGTEIGRVTLPSSIQCIQYHIDSVWVGLANGTLAVFRREWATGAWDITSPVMLPLGVATDEDGGDSSEVLPVSCILPIKHGLYAACGRKVWVIDESSLLPGALGALGAEPLKSFVVHPRNGAVEPGSTSNSVHQMAQSGVGLWVAFRNSATICLYHTETFRHLQDINIASNVSRVLAAREVSQPQRSIHVTALMASRGLLWVGTNVGIALTVPLPRLEGVPIISGRANISYHAHFGPVSFFLNLQPKVVTEVHMCSPASSNAFSSICEESESDNQSLTHTADTATEARQDDGGYEENLDASLNSLEAVCAPETNGPDTPPPLQPQDPVKDCYKAKEQNKLSEASPSTPTHTPAGPLQQQQQQRSDLPRLRRHPRRSRTEHASRRTSKTLPRGFSLASQDMSSLDCDVFGLYGELLNVKDYDCDSGDIVRQADQDLRKSDPELDTIPYRVSTLDRRVKMKTNRPRSLDMSSWSVESRGSVQTTSSSEAGSERPSPCVSRNASFQSNNGSTAATCTNAGSNASLASTGGKARPAVITYTPTPASSSSTATSSAASSNNNNNSKPPLEVTQSCPASPEKQVNKHSIERSASSASTGSARFDPHIATQSESPGSKSSARGQPSDTKPCSAAAKAKKKLEDKPKTLITLMGGRGYINWRRRAPSQPHGAQVNNCDAFLVIWEMKL